MRASRFGVFGLASLLVTVCAVGTTFAGPANVIREDGLCNVGWFGCTYPDDAMMLPDGSYTCIANIRLVSIQADFLGVEPDAHGNEMNSCSTQLAFGQPNPEGTLGGGGEVVALPLATVCLFLPDACQGNGALIANPRTIGSLAVCSMGDATTTQMQEVVTPSGNATLKCFLPDPPEG